MNRAPGMVDVAREAGVSHVTVSRVLNGHPSVRPETRARVEAAIEKLGYRRNSVARALKSVQGSVLRNVESIRSDDKRPPAWWSRAGNAYDTSPPWAVVRSRGRGRGDMFGGRATEAAAGGLR